ncbi:MAG: UDP-N-acetylmuramoyl-L-alanyl-D-glutamate--2,6-diaminopimelate ligase [Candidatus Saccharibacteria bacterium]|nr:UDP-N-acetylmuramoyl-L-alanyl-D-glutamate--2,6-diaminopimelate ligase [Candidatus Saccharibacteria bacterium]
MKNGVVKVTRKVLPKGAVKRLESKYRKSRVKLVSARYGHPAKDLKVIAITGTNGKTTTANYLNEILKEAGKKTALFSTAVIELDGEKKLNDKNATVPLTSELQKFFRDAKDAGVDYVILEATSHALDQYKLEGVPIEAAVMTNLTQDHLDYHHTMENYAAAKGKLFASNPRIAVLNRDDEWFDYFDDIGTPGEKMTYGTNKGAETRITDVKLYKKGSEVSLEIDHQTKLKIATSLPGKYNVYNLTAAATLAYLLHIDLNSIREGIANLESIPGRFEIIETKEPYEVVVDYAHTPDALTQLLQAVRQFTKNRVILVFGATGDRDKMKRPIMGEVAVKNADRIVVTDEESYNEDPKTIRKMVLDGISNAKGDAKTEEIADRRDAIAKALSIAKKGDSVVITGMGHEVFRIVKGEKIPWNDGDAVREILVVEKPSKNL